MQKDICKEILIVAALVSVNNKMLINWVIIKYIEQYLVAIVSMGSSKYTKMKIIQILDKLGRKNNKSIKHDHSCTKNFNKLYVFIYAPIDSYA